VKLIASNVCNTDSIFKVVTSVSTDDMMDGTIPELYPNPVKDLCSVRLTEGHELISAEWLSLDGKLIRSESEIKQDDSGLYQFDIHDFASGTYLLVVKTDKGTLVGRVLKQ
jgi:hypothetical protein